MDLKQYKTSPDIFDELLTGKNRARPGLADLASFLKKSTTRQLNERRHDTELAMPVTLCVILGSPAESENLDLMTDEDDAMSGIVGASITYRLAFGPNAGRKALTLLF